METRYGSPNGSALLTSATGRRKWAALAVLCLGQLMIVLDVTVVNVALPTIQKQLHFTQANLAWVVNAYLLTFGGLMLLAGRAADLLGRRLSAVQYSDQLVADADLVVHAEIGPTLSRVVGVN